VWLSIDFGDFVVSAKERAALGEASAGAVGGAFE
jgi:hypothetical protein